MFYNCIEKTEQQKVNELANLIHIEELTLIDLSDSELLYFQVSGLYVPEFMKVQAI